MTAQELRNAIYTGEWLTEAKKYFSKTACPAYAVGSDYMKGELNRQYFIETAIRWIAARNGKEIEDYMAQHQHDTNCNELWLIGEDKKAERVLHIRVFYPKMARAAYERQNGVCQACKKHFDIEGMQADHITPWSKGGRTTAENCQMLCDDCNRRKSNI